MLGFLIWLALAALGFLISLRASGYLWPRAPHTRSDLVFLVLGSLVLVAPFFLGTMALMELAYNALERHDQKSKPAPDWVRRISGGKK